MTGPGAAATGGRTRRTDLGRWLLTLAATSVWAVGWLVGKVLTLAVATVAWLVAAVQLGFTDARPSKPRPPAPDPTARYRPDGRRVA